MHTPQADPCVITGIGVTTAIGQGKAAFLAALLAGEHAFAVMRRPCRQHGASAFLGAELPELRLPEALPPQLLRQASFSAQVALATLEEAWQEAQLAQLDPERVGLIIGGANLQQRSQVEAHARHCQHPEFIRPNYGVAWMDTDMVGIATEQFGIRGASCTVGGASASGQLAVLRAVQAVQSGELDVGIAIGALTDLSHFECQALCSLGAMGSERYADRPDEACRPFDRGHDGFLYGESCAALVVERESHARQRGLRPWCRLPGWAIVMDAHRNPDPSHAAETRVIRRALTMAGLGAADIDYVNPHGTGSPLGDAIELSALNDCGLAHARINSTKSLTGHGLCAAGAVELAATLLQMRAGRLHPSRNLDDPIAASFNWVRSAPVVHRMRHALTLSYGFGGFNTALCISHCPD
jgi:malonyl-ACP decarboxylase